MGISRVSFSNYMGHFLLYLLVVSIFLLIYAAIPLIHLIAYCARELWLSEHWKERFRFPATMKHIKFLEDRWNPEQNGWKDAFRLWKQSRPPVVRKALIFSLIIFVIGFGQIAYRFHQLDEYANEHIDEIRLICEECGIEDVVITKSLIPDPELFILSFTDENLLGTAVANIHLGSLEEYELDSILRLMDEANNNQSTYYGFNKCKYSVNVFSFLAQLRLVNSLNEWTLYCGHKNYYEGPNEYALACKMQQPKVGLSKKYILYTQLGESDIETYIDNGLLYIWTYPDYSIKLAAYCYHGPGIIRVEEIRTASPGEWHEEWVDEEMTEKAEAELRRQELERAEAEANAARHSSGNRHYYSREEDDYNVMDYDDPLDFYEDNPDDFWDEEDAEDYWNEYHDDW